MLTFDLLLAALAAVPQALLDAVLHFRELSLAQMSAGVAGSATTLAAALLDAASGRWWRARWCKAASGRCC